MSKIVAWFASESHRAYLYRLALVVVPALVAGGLLTTGTAQIVLGVAAAVLGVGTGTLAAINSSTSAGAAAADVPESDPAPAIVRKRIPSTDPRLGRHIHHDPRSRAFAAPESDLSTLKSVRHTRHIPILDQGQVGSCTGNAATGALGSGALWPWGATVLSGDAGADEDFALGVYSDAEVIDGDGPYPPNDNGSCGLSVAKVLTKRGLIAGYTHAFSLNAALTALAAQPVIIGIDWTQDMFNPAPDGKLSITGSVAGGHEVVLSELDVENRRVWLDNSWGPSWGIDGRAYLTWDDLGTLLSRQGDCTIFTPLSVPAPTPTPDPTPDPTPVPVDPKVAALADLTHYAGLRSCPKHVAAAIRVLAG